MLARIILAFIMLVAFVVLVACIFVAGIMYGILEEEEKSNNNTLNK